MGSIDNGEPGESEQRRLAIGPHTDQTSENQGDEGTKVTEDGPDV